MLLEDRRCTNRPQNGHLSPGRKDREGGGGGRRSHPENEGKAGGGRSSLRGGGRRESSLEGPEICLPKGGPGAPGLEGQGPRGGGGGPEPPAGCALLPTLSRATPAKAGAGLTRGERLLTSRRAPPIPPHLLGWQVPPPHLGVGDNGHSTLHPASSRVTWAAGSGRGGGWRLSAPSSPGGSGSGPHAAALPGPDSGPWRRRPRQQKL